MQSPSFSQAPKNFKICITSPALEFCWLHRVPWQGIRVVLVARVLKVLWLVVLVLVVLAVVVESSEEVALPEHPTFPQAPRNANKTLTCEAASSGSHCSPRQRSCKGDGWGLASGGGGGGSQPPVSSQAPKNLWIIFLSPPAESTKRTSTKSKMKSSSIILVGGRRGHVTISSVSANITVQYVTNGT